MRMRLLAAAAGVALVAGTTTLLLPHAHAANVPARNAPARAASAPTAPAPLIAILAYHHISDDPAARLQTVPPSFLRDQIRAARAQGWTFMKLGDVLAQRNRPTALPPRVMVLTFDDGYRSFTEQALPILRAEGVPATLAIITSFVGTSRDDLPPLLDWAELQALAATGDVELVSHTHALHQYEPSNPLGDTAPSVGTRRWREDLGRYEHREEYRGRIAADLAESQRLFVENFKRPASVLVWPYGFHNEMARAQAAQAGFAFSLTLDSRVATPADLQSGCLPRILVTRDRDFTDPSLAWLKPSDPPMQAIQVDVDALWDPDQAVFRSRIENAAMRARAMGATHVILPAFSNPHRDGYLLRSFAMNHQLPVIDDVWSMAAARFAAAGLRIWVQVPTMNLTWAWDRHPNWRVGLGGWFAPPSPWATRLSPDVPEVHQAAVDLLTDLAVYLPIDGMLFDDDASMGAGERLARGGARDPALKARAIRGLIEECKREVRAWRPLCEFGRIVSPQVLEHAGVDPGQSVSLEDCYASHEMVVVPVRIPSVLLAGTGLPESATERLARRAVSRWRALGHADPAPVMFLVPARDPRSKRELVADRQHALAAAARRGGLLYLGSGAVAAEGDLAVGLLERRTVAPPVRNASKH
jgi:biofilm PGA synthesis lipoprotein PgaB